MNKKLISKITLLLVACTFLFAFKVSKDKLHKRDFTVMVTEGKKPKGTADEISFKDGKVYCGDIADQKMGIGTWIKYEMVKDSTYMDEDVEKEYIEVLATSELGADETFEFKCTIDNFEMQGTMRTIKKGKDKKVFTFTGNEKVKKDKKKKDEK